MSPWQLDKVYVCRKLSQKVDLSHIPWCVTNNTSLFSSENCSSLSFRHSTPTSGVLFVIWRFLVETTCRINSKFIVNSKLFKWKLAKIQCRACQLGLLNNNQLVTCNQNAATYLLLALTPLGFHHKNVTAWVTNQIYYQIMLTKIRKIGLKNFDSLFTQSLLFSVAIAT